MTHLSSWDVALLAMGAYVAVMALVRMMASRRNSRLSIHRAELQAEIERQHRAALLAKQAEAVAARAAQIKKAA